MALIYTFGHVTNDIVLKQSQNDTPYVCFYLKEHLGNGQAQTFQVWAWGDLAKHITRIGVRKGSLIWISGTLQLTDCTIDQGARKTKRMKVYLSTCGYVYGRQSKQPEDTCNEMASLTPPFAAELDGDRMPLPE